MSQKESRDRSRQALLRAIDLYDGNQTRFADALTEHIAQGRYLDKVAVTQQNVSSWLRTSKVGVPAEMCIPIVLLCRDRDPSLTLAVLRPDLWSMVEAAAE